MVEGVWRGFASDNYAGIHPDILDAMSAVNPGHQVAYGDDVYTQHLNALAFKLFIDRLKVLGFGTAWCTAGVPKVEHRDFAMSGQVGARENAAGFGNAGPLAACAANIHVLKLGNGAVAGNVVFVVARAKLFGERVVSAGG